MKRTILIVEDEMIIAENMRLMISELEGYESPEIACSIDEANEYLSKEFPELVLLDIRLGDGESGIDFSDTLNKMSIPFLFITSHGDSSTIRSAIKKEPIGYVVKPVNKQTLHSQLELAFSKLNPNHIYSFRSGHHDIRIAESQIVFLKSDNIYTELHTSDERYVIRKSTKNILDELHIKLIQVHRSYFVNPDHIVEANAVLKLNSGQTIPLSRTYKPEVLRIIFGRP